MVNTHLISLALKYFQQRFYFFFLLKHCICAYCSILDSGEILKRLQDILFLLIMSIDLALIIVHYRQPILIRQNCFPHVICLIPSSTLFLLHRQLKDIGCIYRNQNDWARNATIFGVEWVVHPYMVITQMSLKASCNYKIGSQPRHPYS